MLIIMYKTQLQMDQVLSQHKARNLEPEPDGRESEEWSWNHWLKKKKKKLAE